MEAHRFKDLLRLCAALSSEARDLILAAPAGVSAEATSALINRIILHRVEDGLLALRSKWLLEDKGRVRLIFEGSVRAGRTSESRTDGHEPVSLVPRAA